MLKTLCILLVFGFGKVYRLTAVDRNVLLAEA